MSDTSNVALSAAEAWLAEDPDPQTRAELEELMKGDPSELAARFAGRLQFGTAGLRGELGAGPLRMNRVIVRRAAAGLVSWALSQFADARQRGIVIGFDARRNSDVFAMDTARVCAAAGVRAMVLPGPLPTPVAAFAVRHLGACAGVMVTASHNPPRDNGYKVYLQEGRQIVSPIDEEISGHIDAVTAIELAPEDHHLIEHVDVTEAYLAHASTVCLTSSREVHIAYTPMHGVGRDTALAAFERLGFPAPSVVAEQAEPDPTFPTVAFPNPEEPGAMDLLLALAEKVDADIAIANDPDADRLAAAIPTNDGWRALRGDEIGWLFGDHILRHTVGDDRLVVTTVVSSTMLAQIASDHGVHYAETFTGFKWIARTALEHPGERFVFGYEQALGYLVTDQPLDKDGLTAALVMAEIVAGAKASGASIEDRLAELEARFGKHVTTERSVRVEPSEMGRVMDALRAQPPSSLAGHAVKDVTWIDEATLLRLQCEPDIRVQVRPSGTEPKVKIYGEAIGLDPGPLLDALAAHLDKAAAAPSS
jgi:phosphomannomutase